MMDIFYVLCECNLEPLRELVASIEPKNTIIIIKEPTVCMTMIPAEDSVEAQPFYLGEALTTACEVTVDGSMGYGICLGDEPVRAYCIAVIDAITQKPASEWQEIHHFLEKQLQLIEAAKKVEYNQILQTRVDFKIMEQE
ncbi:phosphonate C-P lyase system protein PhnG [Parasediminibacterium paludis]|uniref:Phosphonate C-P lyase system protein PhnG n=1 Tax=Parasediminibacterium paludis TaxID=908966 RepID=A0ABV8PZ13_9BACT